MPDRRPQGMRRLAQWLTGLPRGAKQAVLLLADGAMVPVALWLAFALKYDSLTHGLERNPLLYLGAIAASIAIFGWLGLYRAVLRFISARAIIAVFSGTLCSAIVLYLLGQFVAARPVSLSVVAIYSLIAFVWVGGSRFIARALLSGDSRAGMPVVIYGAGEAGAQLAVALSAGQQFRPIAYVDEKSALCNTMVSGVRVIAPGELPELVREHDVGRILLAVPRASRKRKAEILLELEPLGVHVQTVPDLNDILAGRARVDELRDVDVEDLLGRDAVPPNDQLFAACIFGKSVMVTGAGGSIGSELCRQILRQQPSRLVLLEVSELALYNIERELRAVIVGTGSGVELVPLLGNAHHQHRVREIMQLFAVQTVYHAAAYKHVPIVEHNMIEGIFNNVFSTWHAAEAAVEARVETFVLVSTDKAVNPTNVMGATKRLAEIVLQGLHYRGGGTRFCMVRFGNVLESSGSVVPLFREQIKRGGPVTVTHPEVTRYFMTIPEAAQLVIQAGSMGRGGDVFVLDMGKPIRIADLARRMVQLSGLSVRDAANPDGDVEILFTGLRPAEKLYEELLIGKNVTGTEHPMIMRAIEHALAWNDVVAILGELQQCMRKSDCATARALLMRAVTEYQPAGDVADLVWMQRPASAQGAVALAESKVADLQAHRARQGERSTRELN